eukprot:Nk52_evm8s2192 gene=Nk52_evmTU8s2192
MQDDSSNELLKHYELREMLGRGSFSTVLKCVHKKTSAEYACKIVNRISGIGKNNDATIDEEIRLLRKFHHPNIVKLVEDFSTPQNAYLIMELVTGGELFDQIVLRKFYSETDASKLIRQALSAVNHMHQNGVVHRDLKPENLLCTGQGDSIKISDLGLATFAQGESGLKLMCGTPGYVSPEVLSRTGYGPKVDSWSLGVILYILLCGFPPFSHKDDGELLKISREGKYKYPSPYWDHISESAKDLIDNLLVVDPSRRYSVEQALRHPWIASGEMALNEHLESTIEQLKKFNARRKFKVAALAVQFSNRLETIFQLPTARTKKPQSIMNIATSSRFKSLTRSESLASGKESHSGNVSSDHEQDNDYQEMGSTNSLANISVNVEKGVVVVECEEVDYATVGFLILSMGEEGTNNGRIISKRCPFMFQYALSKLKPFNIELSSSEKTQSAQEIGQAETKKRKLK